MAERSDTTAPITIANLSGEKGTDNNFKSDVTIVLSGQDNEGGLGVEYTAYRVGDSEWQVYDSPLGFTEEGDYVVHFYSEDKDGNVEEIKTVEFSIDKTKPEAKIFIDLDKLDLEIQGIDNSQTSVVRSDNFATKKKDDAFYTISDLAGNKLIVDVRDRDRNAKDVFSIYALKYNEDSPVVLEKNLFSVSYQGKKQKSNVKEQNFSLKGDVKIRIQYNAKKNQSTIITKETAMEKVKEVKEGLSLLQLVTNKGELEYSY